jgi:hypothetical protein
MNLTITIPDEHIHGCLAEPHIRYWASTAEWTPVAHNPYEYGSGWVQEREPEAGSDGKHLLTHAKLVTALQVMSERSPRHFAAMLSGEYDDRGFVDPVCDFWGGEVPMKTTVTKGALGIDLRNLVEELDESTKTELCRFLVADDRLFQNVLECVVGGDYNNDDPDGSWWFSPDRVAELRAKLLPQMPEVTSGLVRHLMYQRNHQETQANRFNNWAWQLYHAWPRDHLAARPVLPDYEPTGFPTDTEVSAVLGKTICDYGDKCPGHSDPMDRPCGWEPA